MNETTIKTAVAAAGACVSYLVGGVDAALKALLLFMALDYVTGVFSAWHGRRLDSKVGLWGFGKKLMMLVAVVVAAELDRVAGTNGVLRAGAIYYLLANEGLSILENLAAMDVIVPPKLKDALEVLKDKEAGQ
jgi:toxin secretion/phage lysis holin